ncbi:tetratricopeptide repeat protein [Clostridium sp. WILCCON 0269]|uniref:Tetratricopeptide repeat protein n=1 Tax=Candidatus Clostridium eludens TaxID=3381663 RepID=A0ABW8SQ53_9CLOT
MEKRAISIKESKNIICGSTINGNNNYVEDTMINISYNEFDDYKKIEKDIKREKNFFSRLNDDESEKRQETLEYIEELEKKRQSFISEVYTLAEIFNKIPFKSQRLKDAEKYFIEGKLREANTILKTEDMYVDKDRALIDRKIVNKKCSDLSNEFLVKAKLTSLNYENPTSFKDKYKYYKDSTELFSNFNNVFQYTILQADRNNYEVAEKNYREALGKYRKLAEKNPETYVHYVADILNNLAILQFNRNDYQVAEKNYGEALEKYRRLAEKDPETYMPDVAMTLNNLAILQADRNNYKAAAKSYEETLEKYRRLAEKDPETYMPYVATVLNNFAVLQADKNDYEAAEKNYGETLEKYRKLAEKNPETYMPDVAMTLNNLAILQADRNDYGAAEENYGEALSIRRELAEKDPQVYSLGVIETLINIAILYLNSLGDKNKVALLCLEAKQYINVCPLGENYTETCDSILQYCRNHL